MRVVWKEGDVVGLKLKDDFFTVGQMLKDPYVMFFKVANNDGEFADLDVNQVDVLFVVPVARDFLQKRMIGKLKKGVVPRRDPQLPELWIQPKSSYDGGYIWKGGDLVQIDHRVGNLGMNNKVVKRNISPEDKETLDNYELTNIWTETFLVPRLILSLEHGRNIDPLKERIFFGKDSWGVLPP